MAETSTPLAALLLAALFLPIAQGLDPLPSPEDVAPADVVVTQDETWTGATRTIPHDLIVRAPATLRLEGVQLTIGHMILVEEGARLELGPSGETPTRLTALDATIDETHGFWMQVNGTIVSSGTPRTEISRMRGSGLNNLYFPGGGLKVAGRAELADIWLHDSNGTLVTAQGGSVLLERAEVDSMGFLTLGALGPMTILDSVVRGSHFGMMGRTLCDYIVERSRIEALTEPVMVNSCPIRIRDSELVGGRIGLYAAGTAMARLQDVRIFGYQQDGIHGKTLPNDVNPNVMDYPQIFAERVHLEAATTDKETHGLFLMGTLAQVRNSTIAGNTRGIFAKENSLLDATGNSFVRNKMNAILLTNARFVGDLMDNEYGGISDRNLNGVLPIAAKVPVRAVVTAPGGEPAPGILLQVYAAGNSTPVAQMGGADVTYGELELFTHSLDTTDLTPKFLGPFTYEIHHPLLSEPVRGDLDLADPGILVPATEPTGSSFDWSSVPMLALMGLGILLVLLGLLPKRVLRLPFRRGRTPTTPS